MTKHFNNTLPIEVLKIIFRDLIRRHWWQKVDLKHCLTVCKSWHVAAREVYGLTIKVNEDSLEKLSRDIVSFAQKVKIISLMESKSGNVDRTVTSLIWFNIILTCPNLTSIETHFYDDSSYAQCLMDTTTERLGHIQQFDIFSFDYSLQVNFKYCKTVTTLFVSTMYFFVEEHVEFHSRSLVNFVSHFPNLVSLNLHESYVLDIIKLLEAAPQLQELVISSLYEFKSDTKITSNNTCLTVMELGVVQRMDLDSLIFITTRFKKLKILSLLINELITSSPPRHRFERQEYDVEKLLNDLKDYTSDILEVSIHLQTDDVRYTLQNDTEPHITSAKIRCYDNEDEDDDDDESLYLKYNVFQI